MAVVRRVIRWLILLALIAIAVLWPLVFAGSSSAAGPFDDPVMFSEYRPTSMSTATATSTPPETIPREFPSGRHGLFRYWDIANPNSPRVRQQPEITSILHGRQSNPLPVAQRNRRPVPGGQDRRPGPLSRPQALMFLRSATRSRVCSIPGTPVRARNSPAPPARPSTRNRRRCSSGTSSPRRGTTASTAPTSP